MNDRITVTSRQSWLSRLGGSLRGIVIGIVLFLAGWPLLWWNEGRAVITARSLAEGAGLVLSVSAEQVDPAQDGRLIHVSGRAVTDEILVDPDFPGIAVKALNLKRDVQMYQWQERQETKEKKNVGGSTEKETTYTYVKQWSSTLVDSGRLQQPSGHENPSALPYQGLQTTAAAVMVGAYRLPPTLVRQLQPSEQLWLDDKTALGASAGMRVAQGMLYRGTDPSAPQIGDVRISYSYAPEQDVSIVARQSGQTFAEYRTSDGKRSIMMLSPGVREAAEMFASAQQANTMLTWALRFGGFLLMLIGLRLVLGPLAVVGDVLPPLGALVRVGTGMVSVAISAVCALLVIGLSWLVYRPLVGLLFLAAAAGAGHALDLPRLRQATPR